MKDFKMVEKEWIIREASKCRVSESKFDYSHKKTPAKLLCYNVISQKSNYKNQQTEYTEV